MFLQLSCDLESKGEFRRIYDPNTLEVWAADRVDFDKLVQSKQLVPDRIFALELYHGKITFYKNYLGQFTVNGRPFRLMTDISDETRRDVGLFCLDRTAGALHIIRRLAHESFEFDTSNVEVMLKMHYVAKINDNIVFRFGSGIAPRGGGTLSNGKSIVLWHDVYFLFTAENLWFRQIVLDTDLKEDNALHSAILEFNKPLK